MCDGLRVGVEDYGIGRVGVRGDGFVVGFGFEFVCDDYVRWQDYIIVCVFGFGKDFMGGVCKVMFVK